MRCKGTVVPGSPAAPEFIKAQVYFPPSFVNHNPSIQSWLRNVCQAFIENVGIRTVADWAKRSQNTFKWSLTQDGNPHRNTVLPSSTTFPSPERNTSHFIYPGQPHNQATPPSSQMSAASSYYVHDELTGSDLQILDLHDRLHDAEQQLQQLRNVEEELHELEQNYRQTEEQNEILIACVKSLETGAGILINSLQATPVTPSRRPTSSQPNIPLFGVNFTPDTSSYRLHATPTSRFASLGKARAATPSDPAPVNVTLCKSASRQNTPSKPNPRPKVAFQSPNPLDSHQFQSGSSRQDATLHHPAPFEFSMLDTVLQAHRLDHMKAEIQVMLCYIPAGHVDMQQELSAIGVPLNMVDMIAKAISFDSPLKVKSEQDDYE